MLVPVPASTKAPRPGAIESRNSGSHILGSGIYSSLVLSAALTRYPLAAGGVLGQPFRLG